MERYPLLPVPPSLLSPCCGDREGVARHSTAVSKQTLNIFKISMLLVSFFGGSRTSLCCGVRAWHLRHSAAIRLVFSLGPLRSPDVYFLGGSQTSLCCGFRARYPRHSAAIRLFFSFVLLGVSGVPFGVSGRPPGSLGCPLGRLWGVVWEPFGVRGGHQVPPGASLHPFSAALERRCAAGFVGGTFATLRRFAWFFR